MEKLKGCLGLQMAGHVPQGVMCTGRPARLRGMSGCHDNPQKDVASRWLRPASERHRSPHSRPRPASKFPTHPEASMSSAAPPSAGSSLNIYCSWYSIRNCAYECVCMCVCVSGGCSEASAQEKGTTAAFISLASCSLLGTRCSRLHPFMCPHTRCCPMHTAQAAHTHTLTFTLHAGTIRKHTTHL